MSVLTLERKNDLRIKKKRNTSLDVIKLFAAFGVIMTHVPFDTVTAQMFQELFSPLRVPFFFVTALTFFLAGLKGASVHDVFSKAWYRLTLPYLGWSAIYFSLIITKNLFLGDVKDYNVWRVFLYGESAVHLYFLPELLIMQLMVLGIFLQGNPSFKNRRLGLVFIGSAILYLLLGYVNDCFGVTSPTHVISYLLITFLLANKVKNPAVQWRYSAIGAIFVVVSVLINFYNTDSDFIGFIAATPLGGIGLLLMALGFPFIKMPKWMGKLSNITFGVYLSHIIFLEAFFFLFERIFTVEVYYNFKTKIIVTTFIFILSVIFTLFLRSIPFLRVTLLGENR